TNGKARSTAESRRGMALLRGSASDSLTRVLFRRVERDNRADRHRGETRTRLETDSPPPEHPTRHATVLPGLPGCVPRSVALPPVRWPPAHAPGTGPWSVVPLGRGRRLAGPTDPARPDRRRHGPGPRVVPGTAEARIRVGFGDHAGRRWVVADRRGAVGRVRVPCRGGR